MVERLYLTPQIVDEVAAPALGERWIADSALKGFGLRVWRKKSGDAGKAYCVRTTDDAGRSTRRSWSHWDLAYGSSWLFREYSLGDLLERARSEARDHIDQIKGRATLADEEQLQRNSAALLARSLTLEGAAKGVLQAMAIRQVSQRSRDRTFKLFYQHVPAVLGAKLLTELTVADLEAVLSSSSLTPSNLETLRAFLGQAASVLSRFHLEGPLRFYDARDLKLAPRDRLDGCLIDWDLKSFEHALSRLGERQDRWRQRMCIRFYLEFHAPLVRVMRARWDEVFDVRGRRLRGLAEEARFYREWRWSDRPWHRERFTIQMNSHLMDVLRLVREQYPASPFLFPSSSGRRVPHIATVAHAWTEALHDLGLPFVSLKDFRERYHEELGSTAYWFDDKRYFEPPPFEK